MVVIFEFGANTIREILTLGDQPFQEVTLLGILNSAMGAFSKLVRVRVVTGSPSMVEGIVSTASGQVGVQPLTFTAPLLIS
jgi:hypothetical protein